VNESKEKIRQTAMSVLPSADFEEIASNEILSSCEFPMQKPRLQKIVLVSTGKSV